MTTNNHGGGFPGVFLCIKFTVKLCDHQKYTYPKGYVEALDECTLNRI